VKGGEVILVLSANLDVDWLPEIKHGERALTIGRDVRSTVRPPCSSKRHRIRGHLRYHGLVGIWRWEWRCGEGKQHSLGHTLDPTRAIFLSSNPNLPRFEPPVETKQLLRSRPDVSIMGKVGCFRTYRRLLIKSPLYLSSEEFDLIVACRSGYGRRMWRCPRCSRSSMVLGPRFRSG
jgi:hypothetical protein